MCHIDVNVSITVLFGGADSRLANLWKEAGIFISQQPLNWQHTPFLGWASGTQEVSAVCCYKLGFCLRFTPPALVSRLMALWWWFFSSSVLKKLLCLSETVTGHCTDSHFSWLLCSWDTEQPTWKCLSWVEGCCHCPHFTIRSREESLKPDNPGNEPKSLLRGIQVQLLLMASAEQAMQHQAALPGAGQSLVLPPLPVTHEQHRAHNCYSLACQTKLAISVGTLEADGNLTVHG